MAIYRSYGSSDYQQAAELAAQCLQDSGIFESVTISDNVISCTYGGETVATFTYSSGRIDVTFGAYSVYAADIDAFWIGGTKNGVLLDHHNRYVNPTNYRLYSFAVCRSQSGVPMLMFHELGVGSSAANNRVLTCDAPSVPEAVTDLALSTNTYYSNLCGICTIYTAASSASASNVYRYVERQTNVPIDSVSVVSIASAQFLTDGCFAVSDE